MIKGFDAAVDGMTVGETKSVNIPAEDAYGSHREELVHEFPASSVPEDLSPEVGMKLNMSGEGGRQFPVTVVKVTDDVITLDANHELAGKDLNFEIELMEIV